MSRLLAFALALLIPMGALAAVPTLRKGGGDGALRTARITFTTGDSGQSADIPNVCSSWRISYISGTGGVADVYALQSPGQAVGSGTLLTSLSTTSATVTTVSTAWPYLAVNINTAPSGNTTTSVFMYCQWEGAGGGLERGDLWIGDADQSTIVVNFCLQSPIAATTGQFNTNNTNASVIPVACAGATNGYAGASINFPAGVAVKARRMTCIQTGLGGTNGEGLTLRPRWRNLTTPATQAFAGSQTVVLLQGTTSFVTIDVNDQCPYTTSGCGFLMRITAEDVTTGTFTISCHPTFEVS